MGRRKARRYRAEFNAEAVRLVSETEAPMVQIARDLGSSVRSLELWRRAQAAEAPAPRTALTEDERTELERLRREIHQVRMERDILKKATAFFARQSE
jgi:transposase